MLLLTVLVIGWLLGSSVGVGTLVYALGIGPVAHVAIPRLAIGSPNPQPAKPDPSIAAPRQLTAIVRDLLQRAADR